MKRSLPTLIVSVCITAHAFAEGKSYVGEAERIVEIKNPHKEAQTWATCAAAYNIMAELIETSAPARSKQLAELANGAELAVIISMVASEINNEMTPEKFNNAWNFSKFSGSQMPKTIRTTILADLESDNSKGKRTFLNDLGKTVAVCMANLDGQQTYIDMWRDLMKSGLLKAPDK